MIRSLKVFTISTRCAIVNCSLARHRIRKCKKFRLRQESECVGIQKRYKTTREPDKQKFTKRLKTGALIEWPFRYCCETDSFPRISDEKSGTVTLIYILYRLSQKHRQLLLCCAGRQTDHCSRRNPCPETHGLGRASKFEDERVSQCVPTRFGVLIQQVCNPLAMCGLP